MRPAELTAGSFRGYPPLAQTVAVRHLAVLQQLPLNLLGILLSQIIGYDWRFPVEREEIDGQLTRLSRATPAQLTVWMAPFVKLPMEDSLYREPWASAPSQFVEKLTAFLWSAHAIDGFREAAKGFGETLQSAEATEPGPRWCCVVVGRDARQPLPDLFRQLRSRGTLFTAVEATGGLDALLAFSAERAGADALPYRHWYVDGGDAASAMVPAQTKALCTISYGRLDPLRQEVLRRMRQASTSGTVGPESLRTMMAQLRAADLPGSVVSKGDPVLENFEISLLTEGSGTQLFSTTFVQWAGREILRRAQPSTLVMRYAPRQADRPMNDLLLPAASPPKLDPEGSLVDANMGAYYTWLSLQRLPGGANHRFLVWRESGHEALAIAPGMAHGVQSTQTCSVSQILKWMA